MFVSLLAAIDILHVTSILNIIKVYVRKLGQPSAIKWEFLELFLVFWRILWIFVYPFHRSFAIESLTSVFLRWFLQKHLTTTNVHPQEKGWSTVVETQILVGSYFVSAQGPVVLDSSTILNVLEHFPACLHAWYYG